MRRVSITKSNSVLQDNHGFSLMELMVASSLSIMLSLAVGSIAADAVKAKVGVEDELDYQLVVGDIRNEFRKSKCEDIIDVASGIPYDPMGADTPLLSLKINNGYDAAGDYVAGSGTLINVGSAFPNSGQILETLSIKATGVAGTNLQLVFDVAGVPTSMMFERHVTNINLGLQSSSKQVLAKKPSPIPLTLVVNPLTNVVAFCGGAVTNTELCLQAGGVFYANSNTCDVRPAYGGCAKGGKYSYISNNCDTANVYTGACSCPAGFTAVQIADFAPSKNSYVKQYECLNCTAAKPINELIAPNTPPYDEDALAEDIACMDTTIASAGPPVVYTYNSPACPCYDTNSTRCQCWASDYEYSPDGGVTKPCKQPSAADPNVYEVNYCYSQGQGSCKCEQQELNALPLPHDLLTNPAFAAQAAVCDAACTVDEGANFCSSPWWVYDNFYLGY